jgi:hypothetical protein
MVDGKPTTLKKISDKSDLKSPEAAGVAGRVETHPMNNLLEGQDVGQSGEHLMKIVCVSH